MAPKSINFARPSRVQRRLRGVMSRCTSFIGSPVRSSRLLCAYVRPSHTSEAIFRHVAIGSCCCRFPATCSSFFRLRGNAVGKTLAPTMTPVLP